jgi:hypothetical protein
MRGIYETILEEFPPDFGKALSKKEREDKKMFVSTLIYGEIDFDSFGMIVALFAFRLSAIRTDLSKDSTNIWKT